MLPNNAPRRHELPACRQTFPRHIHARASRGPRSVRDFARKGANAKPYAVDGLRNAQWVAMDYADVLVHVFLPEVRDYYNLENLWADAKLTQIPDLD